MKKSLMTIVSICVVALLGSGCVSLEEYDRVQKHLETEQEANRALAAENARYEGEVTNLRTKRSTLETQVQELKNSLENQPSISEEDLLERFQEIWGNDLRGDDWEMVRSGGAVGVRMDDSGVLFKSGSWDLTSQTKERLKKLADVMKSKLEENPTLFVRVDGHTDSDPIRKLKSKGIENNIHLSSRRAMAVRSYLVDSGLPKDRVFVAGFGEFWPVASGNSSKDKMRNRRVEVYLGDPDALSIGHLPDAQVSK